MRVGVAGVDGLQPSDAVPVTSNCTDHVVTFARKATLAEQVGKDVVLELVLDRAAAFTVGFAAG